MINACGITITIEMNHIMFPANLSGTEYPGNDTGLTDKCWLARRDRYSTSELIGKLDLVHEQAPSLNQEKHVVGNHHRTEKADIRA